MYATTTSLLSLSLSQQQQQQHKHEEVCSTTASSTTAVSEQLQHAEQLQQDINELREIAAHRLENLLEQMEDLKLMTESYNYRNNMNQQQQQQQQQTEAVNVTNLSSKPVVVDSTNNKKNEESLTAPTIPTPTPTHGTTTTIAPSTTDTQTTTTTTSSSLNLLDDTTWKIVYNIGREKGTWMPKDWAVSGDRLLFQCTVQFTNDKLMSSSDPKHDDFLNGKTDSKVLIVKDAFIIPRGVGNNSVGRRPLPVQSVGAYRVCRNQGPYGTDIVRFYIELINDVTVLDHVSDVYCPSGRIYATCGYFPQQQHLVSKKHEARDKAHENFQAAVRDYEHKQFLVESDSRGLLNVDHMKLIKESWDAKKKMEQMALKWKEAQQREPEKQQLRLNKAQTVGLTREGGVCCKVHKGLAMEYHILGQIEVGCCTTDDQQRHLAP